MENSRKKVKYLQYLCKYLKKKEKEKNLDSQDVAVSINLFRRSQATVTFRVISFGIMSCSNVSAMSYTNLECVSVSGCSDTFIQTTQR